MRRASKPSVFDTIKRIAIEKYNDSFPEPAEVRLLELCGAVTITIGRIKRDGKPMTIILSNGKLLKSEKFKRVAMDNKAILYMNDLGNAICIQSAEYEHDIVAAQELDDSFIERGVRVRYIPQRWLENNPVKALQSVQQFIYQ